jgi:hypothetical protein
MYIEDPPVVAILNCWYHCFSSGFPLEKLLALPPCMYGPVTDVVRQVRQRIDSSKQGNLHRILYSQIKLQYLSSVQIKLQYLTVKLLSLPADPPQSSAVVTYTETHHPPKYPSKEGNIISLTVQNKLRFWNFICSMKQKQGLCACAWLGIIGDPNKRIVAVPNCWYCCFSIGFVLVPMLSRPPFMHFLFFTITINLQLLTAKHFFPSVQIFHGVLLLWPLQKLAQVMF